MFLLEFSVGNCGIGLQHLLLHGEVWVWPLDAGAQHSIGPKCPCVMEQTRAISAPRAAIGHAQANDGKVSAHSANKAIKTKGRQRH